MVENELEGEKKVIWWEERVRKRVMGELEGETERETAGEALCMV